MHLNGDPVVVLGGEVNSAGLHTRAISLHTDHTATAWWSLNCTLCEAKQPASRA